jgi:hypothetical protein
MIVCRIDGTTVYEGNNFISQRIRHGFYTTKFQENKLMRTLKIILLAAILATIALAQKVTPPLEDTRLTVHTLLREDIFAGFLENDLTRLSRGEKNIEALLESRPKSKSELLAWKAGATLYRAALANEKKNQAEFDQKYKQALALFAEAKQLGPEVSGVAAVTGGSYVLFSDRLPKEYRAAAWASTYDAYQILWKQQGEFVDKLPIHMRGELLGGVAQSALRTGRIKEGNEYLDKILTMLPNTPYEPIAKKWKENPKAAENSTIACMTCHEPGRLEDRLTKLNK